MQKEVIECLLRCQVACVALQQRRGQERLVGVHVGEADDARSWLVRHAKTLAVCHIAQSDADLAKQAM